MQKVYESLSLVSTTKDSFKNDPRLFPEAQIIERYEDTSVIMDFDYEMMIDEMWDNILDS